MGDVPLNLALLRWLLYIHAYMLAYVVDDEALPAQRDMAEHMVHRTECVNETLTINMASSNTETD